MRGSLLLSYKTFIEDSLGMERWSPVAKAAGLGTGVIDAGAVFTAGELARLFAAGAEQLGIPREAMLERFGIHAAPSLLELAQVGGYAVAGWEIMDCLEHLPSILVPFFGEEIARGERAPLRSLRIRYGEVALAYFTGRGFCPFLMGLSKGWAAHFGENIALSEPICRLKGASLCRINAAFTDPERLRQVDVKREFSRVMMESQGAKVSLFSGFKGVPISSQGEVVGFSGDSVTIKASVQQLAALKDQGVANLALPHLGQGLSARVARVDTARNTVHLDSIRLTDGPIGYRKQERVSPDVVVPVHLIVEGREYMAALRDISLGGVSLRVERGGDLRELIFSPVWMHTQVPVRWLDTGDTIEVGAQEAELTGNLLDIHGSGQGADEETIVRIVFVDLTPKQMALLTQYVQERQGDVQSELA